MKKAKRLKVICVSLGGTKLEIGALTQEDQFLASRKLYWRKEGSFKEGLEKSSLKSFCVAVAQRITVFLQTKGYNIFDVDIFGIPFPGPCWDGRWYSNNLTPAFKDGVMFHEEMINALRQFTSRKYTPKVFIVFDAQCDAGGELYHPEGHLYNNLCASATIINVATGIAAGFIHNGRVLINNEDFKSSIHNKYDSGAGQLGRHLWYYPDTGKWQYHFFPRGGIPKIDPPAIRMTERLSGPALAGRLLYRLGRANLLNAICYEDIGIQFSAIKEILKRMEGKDPEKDSTAVTQILRQATLPVATIILRWANDVLADASSDLLDIRACIYEFAEDIAREFAHSLRSWMTAQGWEEVSQRIILTGGIGIHFLESLDFNPSISFCGLIKKQLSMNIAIERSRLTKAAERECYIFRYQFN